MLLSIAFADRGRIMICIVLSFTDLKLFLNRYKYPLLLSMATLGFFAWSLPQWLWGPVVPTVAVVQRDFVYTIVASGHVENPHRVDIGTQLVGTVMHVPVSEGQTVQANQVLLALDNAELIANAKQAAFAVMQARARLQQIHAVQAPVAAQSLVQAQTNEALALRTFRRNQTLFEQGFIGQQQRVAVARGLAMNPTLLLADEPTGNLDSKSADAVFELLRQVSRDQGTTVLFVTHNPELADRCDNTIQVVDGRIQN
jgi:HlyD family secretion protein